MYKLSKIPLTPGPLVVVIKVAQSQAFNHSGPEPFWPPRVPDNVETIAASYVQPGAGGKVRLFNLSPDTKVAGMSITSGTPKALAQNVQYSLGSDWFPVPATAQTYSFTDDLTKKVLTTRVETPPPNPLVRGNIVTTERSCTARMWEFSTHQCAIACYVLMPSGVFEHSYRPTEVNRHHGTAGDSTRRCAGRRSLQALKQHSVVPPIQYISGVFTVGCCSL